MACPAVPGLSGSPSGEKTVALVGLTTAPAAAELGADDDAVDDDGRFSPSSSLLRPPPTLPKILLTTDASTNSATAMTATPAPTPISTLRRRRAKFAYSRTAGSRGLGTN